MKGFHLSSLWSFMTYGIHNQLGLNNNICYTNKQNIIKLSYNKTNVIIYMYLHDEKVIPPKI